MTNTYFATTKDCRVWKFNTVVCSTIRDRHLIARPSACCILQVLGGQIIPTEYYLKNGSFLGISKLGLKLYFQQSSINDGKFNSNRKPIEEVKFEDVGDSSKPIVALFLEEKDAIACARSNNIVEDDKRWRMKTKAVLREIGFGHPFLIISRPKSDHGFDISCYQGVVKKSYASPGKNIEIDVEEWKKLNAEALKKEASSSRAKKGNKLDLISPEEADEIRKLLTNRQPK